MLQQSRHDLRFLYALLPASLITVCALLVWAYVPDEGLGVVLLAAMSYTLCSLFFHPGAPFWRDPFHPSVIYRAWILVGYFGGVIRISADPAFARATMFGVTLTGAFLVFAGDIVLLLVGTSYGRLTKRRRPTVYQKKSSWGASALFLFVYAAGWVWRLYALRQGLLYGTFLGTQLQVTSTSNLMGVLSGLSSLAFIGIAVFSKRAWGPLAFLPLEVIWMVISGSKAAILYTVLPLLLVFFQKGFLRVNLKLFVVILLVAALTLAVFGFVRAYRSQSQVVIAQSGSEDFSPSVALSSARFTMDETADVTIELVDRVNLARSFAFLLEADEQRQLARWDGESYLPILTWYVPRAFWPEKPWVSVGTWFAQEILGWDRHSRSEGAITIWGDAYMNFSWLGVGVISSLWLSLAYSAYRVLIRRGLWGLLFVASTYIQLLLGLEQNAAVPIVAIQQKWIILGAFWLALYLIRQTARPPMVGAQHIG